ncbi:hypothetical protein C7B63_02305 [Bacillus halotolerans]|nr:hypothetical protein [Bacillus subtilis]MDQ7723552.1 hypothetical protein [Bacillus halotolerans]PRP52791.1 hypothetical protein C7B63_02305 [Bacillus halotolerans]PRP60294.1 hypothetical protein C7B66_05025 [Bacillus halotolerans]PRP64959.1 hypothetical protein C7B72_05020 [Bacillus halotolerans]
MKVIIIEGPQADKCINDCYHYLIKLYRKEIQGDSNICKGIDRGASDQGIEHRQPDRGLYKESRD